MTTSILGPHSDADRPKLRAMLARELAADPFIIGTQWGIELRRATGAHLRDMLIRHQRHARKLAARCKQTENNVARETVRAA